MGLFGYGKKKESASTPSTQKEESLHKRYGERPLLLILDNYIIDSMGVLSPEKQAGLAAMVKKVFGGDEDWKKTIRHKLKLHDSLDDSIRQAWSQFQTGNPGVSPFAFAVAFSDRHFAPLFGGIPSDRGDRATDPAQQREAQERKNRSLVLLKQHDVPTITHLPTIETTATSKIRSPQEVARRVTVLSLVAAYAEPGSFPAERLMELLNQRGVALELTPKEHEFISIANPTDRQRCQFTWRYEGANVLLWALGYVDQLDFPANICDVPRTVRTVAQSDPHKFIEEARLREAGSILDEADLIYRYNWACVNARTKNEPAPAGLDAGIVVERHHALNWLIGYQGQDWDNVSTDT